MAKKVKVFTTPTCPWCKMVKDYLNENHIEFENIDVSTNQNAAQEMIDKSGEMGVPQLWIDDKIVVGFDKPQIAKLLEIN